MPEQQLRWFGLVTSDVLVQGPWTRGVNEFRPLAAEGAPEGRCSHFMERDGKESKREKGEGLGLSHPLRPTSLKEAHRLSAS